LKGYGASAVCPYLALAHIRRWHATEPWLASLKFGSMIVEYGLTVETGN